MRITYQQIADIVGVSRGTVDRALNDRGRIDPEVKLKILQVAEQYSFSPNHVGRALARAKNPVKIGIIVHLATIPFFQKVIEGIHQAESSISKLGGELIIAVLPFLNAESQIKSINELLEQGIQGLAISPAQDDALRDRLNELEDKSKIPIITFNTDMKDLKRMCYVGLNNIQAGRTSAGLMDLLLKGVGGKTLIISGHRTNTTNIERGEGFADEIRKSFPNMRIAGWEFNRDDEDEAYRIVTEALNTTPDLSSIYMVSGGQAGACRALEKMKKDGIVKMIAYDTLPDTVKYMNKGVIDFIIDQNAFLQGNLPPHLLFDYLFYGKPIQEENIFTDIRIKTVYNI